MGFSGTVNGTVDIDPGVNIVAAGTATGNSNVYVVLDSTGQLVSGFSIRSIGSGFSKIRFDSGNNIIVAGIFAGTVDVDPGSGVHNLASNGSIDFYIAKYSASGSLVWAGSGGGTGSGDRVTDLHIDGMNRILLTGYFEGTADLDPGPGVSTYSATSQAYDGMLIKLSPSGNLVFVRQFGCTGWSLNINGCCTDPYNSIYLTGAYQGNVDLDPGPGAHLVTSVGSSDILLVKLDENGISKWAHVYGASGQGRRLRHSLEQYNRIDVYT